MRSMASSRSACDISPHESSCMPARWAAFVDVFVVEGTYSARRRVATPRATPDRLRQTHEAIDVSGLSEGGLPCAVCLSEP